jgi:5'-nucleotidase
VPANLDDKLVVALSSRALFDFEEENAQFDANDPRSYQRLQLSRLNQPRRCNRGRELRRSLRLHYRVRQPHLLAVP